MLRVRAKYELIALVSQFMYNTACKRLKSLTRLNLLYASVN